MLKSFWNKNIFAAQDNFIRSMEGAGDILVFETKRKKNKLVQVGLGRIRKIVEQLLDIRKADPTRFDKLMLSKEFQELYSQNKDNASLALDYDTERFLAPFSAAVGQLLRIHSEAVATGNEEASLHAAHNIVWLLWSVSQNSGFDLIVRELLKSLRKMNVNAIIHDDKSVYATSFVWYLETVFNTVDSGDKEFCLDYQDVFDGHFISSVKEIIDKDRRELFLYFVKMVVEGAHNLGTSWPNVQNISYQLMQIDNKSYVEVESREGIGKEIDELEATFKDVTTREEIDKWLERFGLFTQALAKKLSGSLLERLEQLNDEIARDARHAFKLENLDMIVFGLAAYCIYKKKPDYLSEIVEFNQPRDADAHWIGRDIIPTNLETLVGFFFKHTYQIKNKFHFWDDHHGADPYIRLYFLLLCCRFLQSATLDQNGQYSTIENFALPEMDIFRLSGMDFTVEQLVRLIPKLHEMREYLGALGIDSKNLVELADVKLTRFLHALKEKAAFRLAVLHRETAASQEKIEQYKANVLHSYTEAATMRSLLVQLGLFIDNSKGEYTGDSQLFGLGTLSPKGAFLKKWYVHYGEWGAEVGRSIGTGENKHIIDMISEKCVLSNFETIGKIIADTDASEQFIALSLGTMAGWQLRDAKYFTPRWQEGEAVTKAKPQREGTLHFGDKNVPMYQFWSAGARGKILVVNTTKMGQLVQLPPCQSEDENRFRREHFLMEIRAFGDEPDFLNKYIKLGPKCLDGIDNQEDKINYLKERVLIRVFERFEFHMAEDFQGYSVEMREE